MMIDQLTVFLSNNATAQTMVAGAGVAVVIGDPIDLLGQGVGTAPADIIGNVSVFGEDAGIGRYVMAAQINIGDAFTTATSATATFSIEGAEDDPTTHLPGTYEVFGATGALPVAELTANTVIRMPMPPTPPAMPRPRYLRMVMTPPAATDFTAGTVTFAGLVIGRDDLANKQAASNYAVA